MPTNSVRIHAVKLSTNFSKDSCRIFTSVRCIHRLIRTNTRTYLQSYTKQLPSHKHLHTLSYLHKHFKDLFYIHLLTHTLTYTHTSTYMVLHTKSVRRPSGRADEINLTNTAALNPFQKICYEVMFRNVAPSRGPRLCRPFKIILSFFLKSCICPIKSGQIFIFNLFGF